MLKVDLPFTTDDSVVASVNVQIIGSPLPRHALAGLCLTDEDGILFTVRKTNIDGYIVLAPGDVEFIGKPGEEGDPSNYTVKYWPAKDAYGPLRIISRGSYAYFQVGPDDDGKYKNFFHSAIQERKEGLGFGIFVNDDAATSQATGDDERWVRFSQFKVTKN